MVATMAMTRGPLPSSVYWRRRLMVLTLALVLVVVIAKLLGGGSDGRSGHAAEQVASDAHSAVTVTVTPSPSDSGQSPNVTVPAASGSASGTALPAPSGDCNPADVTVTPSVTDAYVGRPVTVDLELRTKTAPACTWSVSPQTLQVRISKGGVTVWSTLDCPKSISPSTVTVYHDAVSKVALRWLGHRSDETCSVHTPWATRGTYQITATALGGEPAEGTFALGVPGETPSASSTPSGLPSQSVTPTLTPYGQPTGQPSGSATGSATGQPSGAAGQPKAPHQHTSGPPLKR